MGLPENLRSSIAALPRGPGVYVFRDDLGEILYVGKAKSLRDRVRSYFRRDAADSLKLARLVPRIASVESFLTGSEPEALLLESNLIKEYRPRFNVQLRDDKSFPYVKVTVAEDYPRVLVTRTLESDGSRYFGPFTGVGTMRRALRLICRRHRVRTCHYELLDRAPDRPCLDYHIERCLAPCVGLQSRESYRAEIDQVVSILAGNTGDLKRELRAEMREAASSLEFELAAELRDVIRGLEILERRQTTVDFRGGDRDVLGIAVESASACTILLRVRDGHLLGREVRFLDNVDEQDLVAVVDAALKGFLLRRADIPAQILVPVDFPDRQLLESLLSERRGGTVRILRPGRGTGRRLLDLASRNAEHLLEERADPDSAFAAGEGEISAFGGDSPAARGLASALELRTPPRDLVCFDISTLGGRESVGSAVWLRDGRPHREEYRRFRVRGTADGITDDYAMMQEVVGRYFQRRVSEGRPLPDLVLIDGGRGQLGAAVQAMEGAGASDLPVVALAKRREELYVPGRDQPLVLDGFDPALHWLQRVRDEAHRFAVGYNRKLRRKRTLKSVLGDVPGVGAKREADLLRRFGSPAAISRLDPGELMQVPGIGPATARRILDALSPLPGKDMDRGNRS
ncbi:MAG: excinuclease ABC subunit UvrC [marine benthic group bacterium]|nr:excinuclease ABC subunit UvrC [Gemmatimonadota bacterium]